ncbi:ATPase family associated with various cellular activities (AAA) [Gemmata sp. SH-PL17]|uniref:AAA family ATPase n=1 Tax=Gemmata sp. SH-PL17 TaxID=1630693 RepID=UPI00078CEECF|nr:MoxR family ATPase [Gemmata sp. SH-PL17]AMV29619.1 ATPase family associated with various cellular activities (AAA) [Gemmata sp. SH-PL17]
MSARDSILELKKRIGTSIIGQQAAIDRLLVALLADGHVLMEGLPGLAKTRTIKTLAKNLESEFRRIQFTPDLLPADVTGSEVYYDEGGKGTFKFQPGPIFGNLVLADEINRAPAKAQAALLEAMEERQVTVAGTTHALPPLFLVMATQNPIEQEGTYPLPEAQTDRFLMKVILGYGTDDEERQILRLVRGEEGSSKPPETAKLPQQVVTDARAEVHKVFVSEALEKYIVSVIAATRRPGDFSADLKKWIQVGASPRGTLALDRCSRAYAWLQGRDHVTPDDVRAIAPECLRHRLILSYEAAADGTTPDQVVAEVIKKVAVP